ncbi:hypothetical protein FOCG_04517 [Fusarium oxysporum f. sp. radicis-lycopersici 26381]|nr:hypothetical protein FOCG_04517 [Fusarium oxysporum f. sp. radicis-lycopersici 26381]
MENITTDTSHAPINRFGNYPRSTALSFFRPRQFSIAIFLCQAISSYLLCSRLFIHSIIKSKDTKQDPGFLVILVMFRCPIWIALSSTIFKDSTNQHSRQAL